MADVRAYADEHRVPIHPMHDRGYPSIGCAPCTRAIQPGEHPRAGRWWWEDPENKECGIHLPTAVVGVSGRSPRGNDPIFQNCAALPFET